jgi:hypothetical protein
MPGQRNVHGTQLVEEEERVEVQQLGAGECSAELDSARGQVVALLKKLGLEAQRLLR